MGSRRRLILCAVGSALGRASQARLYERVEPVMGTLVQAQLYAPSLEEAAGAFNAAFARARAIEAILSDYEPDSETNRLCRAGGGRVSTELFTVLEAARRIYQESKGAFDVTAGALFRLWRECRRRRILPDAAELARVRTRCGWRHVRLDAAGRTVFLSRTDMIFDFGGIGKGYAADEMLAALRQRGLGAALIAASGDIVAGDAPPGRPGWRVRAAASGETVLLSGRAMSTSGDSEQFVEIGGVRYSHIVDPRSGMALRNSAAVTVIAPSGILADAWATADSVTVAAGGRPRYGKAGRHR